MHARVLLSPDALFGGPSACISVRAQFVIYALSETQSTQKWGASQHNGTVCVCVDHKWTNDPSRTPKMVLESCASAISYPILGTLSVSV